MPGRPNAYLCAVLVECELQIAPGVELQGSQELDRDAHLSHLRESPRPIPHVLVANHLANLAHLLHPLTILTLIGRCIRACPAHSIAHCA